jgi:tRNA(Arg) A34 adenosine deaminase TadA
MQTKHEGYEKGARNLMNKEALERAVKLSKESFQQGKFPAGAVLVKNGEIIYQETSSAYPNQHLHAETKIIDKAIAETGDQLEDYELYTSLAPCLMCFGKIYWSGLKKVYYVLDRTDVSIEMSYEGTHNTKDIYSKLNREIDFAQDKTHFDEAKVVYRAWEEKFNA